MNLKELRKTYGLSQGDISKRFGIPIRTLSSWETGARTAPDYVYRLLEELLYYEDKYGNREDKENNND